MTFDDFIALWKESSGAERANKDEALGHLVAVGGEPKQWRAARSRAA